MYTAEELDTALSGFATGPRKGEVSVPLHNIGIYLYLQDEGYVRQVQGFNNFERFVITPTGSDFINRGGYTKREAAKLEQERKSEQLKLEEIEREKRKEKRDRINLWLMLLGLIAGTGAVGAFHKFIIAFFKSIIH